jgi:adenosine kinase
MSIVISGSIVYDSIALCDRSLRAQIDASSKIGATFRPRTIRRYFGGTGANIAYNLRVLGESPLLVGNVGDDFASYADWLDEHAISRRGLAVIDGVPTASCTIVVDEEDNRITIFSSGAMECSVPELPVEATIGVIAPSSRSTMLDHARRLRDAGVPCIIDPGPAVSLFHRDELRQLIAAATIYTCNEREWKLTCTVAELTPTEIAERIEALVVTRGDAATIVMTRAKTTEFPTVAAKRVVDPVGCGDAHRAGMAFALAHNLGLATGVRLGALLGALKVAELGPQSLRFTLDSICDLFEQRFGESLL